MAGDGDYCLDLAAQYDSRVEKEEKEWRGRGHKEGDGVRGYADSICSRKVPEMDPALLMTLKSNSRREMENREGEEDKIVRERTRREMKAEKEGEYAYSNCGRRSEGASEVCITRASPGRTPLSSASVL